MSARGSPADPESPVHIPCARGSACLQSRGSARVGETGPFLGASDRQQQGNSLKDRGKTKAIASEGRANGSVPLPGAALAAAHHTKSFFFSRQAFKTCPRRIPALLGFMPVSVTLTSLISLVPACFIFIVQRFGRTSRERAPCDACGSPTEISSADTGRVCFRSTHRARPRPPRGHHGLAGDRRNDVHTSSRCLLHTSVSTNYIRSCFVFFRMYLNCIMSYLSFCTCFLFFFFLRGRRIETQGCLALIQTAT